MGNLSTHLEKIKNLFPCYRRSRRNNFGETPLHVAVKNGNEKKVLKLIKKGAKVNAINSDGFTSLHFAVKYGHPNLIKILMEHGADIDKPGFHGLTPLHMLMVARNRLRCLEELLRYKPDVNAREILGNTTLQIMVMISPHNTDIILKLLEHGSNPNNLNIVGNNCVHNMAMLEGFMSSYRTKVLAKSLIDAGLNVNEKNGACNTPLHFASRSNSALVGVLLEEGADINNVNNQGLTPFDVAVKYNANDVLQHLIKYVVLREHRGHYVNKTITEQINSNDEYKKIHAKFEDEMLVLQLNKISDDYPLTYYDMLCNNKKRTQIIKNENLLKKISVDNIKYTSYKKEIVITIDEALEAVNIAEEAYAIVDSILGDRLPHLCIENISSYLRAKDLTKLGYYLHR